MLTGHFLGAALDGQMEKKCFLSKTFTEMFLGLIECLHMLLLIFHTFNFIAICHFRGFCPYK